MQSLFIKRFFSTNNASKFKLIKFNPYLKEDYLLFKNLMLENIQYSALQFMIPNLRQDIDLEDVSAVAKYFSDPEKEKYLQDAYKYVTNNHHKTKLGYCKVLTEDGQFIGNAGWIMHDVKDDGTVEELERGIHLKKSYRSIDGTKGQLNTSNPKTGAKVMKLVIDNLDDHKSSLNPDGKLVSSILESNKRSQAFTQRHKLNLGEPTKKLDGVYKWEQKIGTFTKRIPEIKNLLNETIKKENSFREGL